MNLPYNNKDYGLQIKWANMAVETKLKVITYHLNFKLSLFKERPKRKNGGMVRDFETYSIGSPSQKSWNGIFAYQPKL
mgnify:FL=1